MKKLNFILQSTSPSQKTLCLKKAIDKNIPTVIYTTNLFKRVMELDLPNLEILDLFSTWGDVNVFTTFDEGLFVTRCPINSKKIFYMWDLDWHCNGLNYDTCLEILKKCDKIYCRCEAHKQMVENFFNVQCEIMTNFDMKVLYEL